MISHYFEAWLVQYRRSRAAGQVGRLPAWHAKGAALLVRWQGEALQAGNAAELARATDALNRFLEASTVAHAMAAKALASWNPLPPALVAGPVTENAVPPDRPALARETADASVVHRYVISSTTLAEAHAYLTQHMPGKGAEPEFMLAVTGVEMDGVRTLERLFEVQMAHQSFGQASFDMQAFSKIINVLYEHDHHLHAVFHSHRFAGPPSPSGTDMRLQSILEEFNYPAIQAVLSEDSYVRFFSGRRKFAVQIHGSGVRPVDGRPNTFRIVQFSALPYPTAAAAARGRGNGLRPL